MPIKKINTLLLYLSIHVLTTFILPLKAVDPTIAMGRPFMPPLSLKDCLTYCSKEFIPPLATYWAWRKLAIHLLEQKNIIGKAGYYTGLLPFPLIVSKLCNVALENSVAMLASSIGWDLWYHYAKPISEKDLPYKNIAKHAGYALGCIMITSLALSVSMIYATELAQ